MDKTGFEIVAGNSEGKTRLQRCLYDTEYNIEMDFREIRLDVFI